MQCAPPLRAVDHVHTWVGLSYVCPFQPLACKNPPDIKQRQQLGVITYNPPCFIITIFTLTLLSLLIGFEDRMEVKT